MISTVRLVSSGVKRWRDPAMVRRWVGTGMIEAQRSFRRIEGCKDMGHLVDAVHAEVARRLAEEEGGVVTPPSTIRLPPEQLWDHHRNPTGLGTSSG
jgi:hypothetical protein